MNVYKENAKVFKAFCDESRLRIIDLLCTEQETCACVLLDSLSVSQSTLSHHMKLLVESGLVNSRKDGRKVMYSISSENAIKCKSLLNSILDCKLCLKKSKRNQ